MVSPPRLVTMSVSQEADGLVDTGTIRSSAIAAIRRRAGCKHVVKGALQDGGDEAQLWGHARSWATTEVMYCHGIERPPLPTFTWQPLSSISTA